MHPGINQRDKAGGEQLFHSRDGVVLALANARRNAHPAPPPSRHRRADRYQYRVLLLTSIDPTRATQDSTRPIGQGHLLRCFQPVIRRRNHGNKEGNLFCIEFLLSIMV